MIRYQVQLCVFETRRDELINALNPWLVFQEYTDKIEQLLSLFSVPRASLRSVTHTGHAHCSSCLVRNLSLLVVNFWSSFIT